MQNLSEPLSDDELDFLDAFLLDRIDESHDDDPDFDCGLLNISELDGFLTAIVSGPATVLPSVWMPAIWGAAAPEWETKEELESILLLLMRHMNSIAYTLRADIEGFEPIFSERRVRGKTYVIVDEWCHGYMHAIHLDAGAWRLDDPVVREMLLPIETNGTEHGMDRELKMPEAQAKALRDAVPDAVRKLYSYWLTRRAVTPGAIRRAAPKIGRNDPCHCGSGKKYKHCCLQ